MGKVIQFATDSLRSFIGALGDPFRDKSASVYYDLPAWTDADLLNAYRGSWLPHKIVDIPAKDMVREWRDWQAEGDQIEKIEAEENRLNLRAKVFEAMVKARLFGGAGIYIGTGDTRPEEEFNPERIAAGGVRYLNVMLRRHLNAGDIETDPQSEWFGKPKWYDLQGPTGSVRIHPSRLVIFTGAPHPDEELSNVNRGWGESVLISVMDAIKNADATAANIASLVFEAKVDVIRVPQMMASLADPAYRQKLLDRFQLAAAAKGINQTLLLDKEEEYDQKSASFTNLPDILDRFLQIVAGAADIPLTRLLGMSPGGMNATGQHDMKNYHDRLKADQELHVTPAMHRLDEALIRSALGTRPPEVHYRWSPLEQMSEKEQAEIGDKIATTVEKMNNTGLFPPEALARSAANAFVENGVFPGLEQAIDEAGGLPDYEMEAEKEAEAEQARMEAMQANRQEPVGPGQE